MLSVGIPGLLSTTTGRTSLRTYLVERRRLRIQRRPLISQGKSSRYLHVAGIGTLKRKEGLRKISCASSQIEEDRVSDGAGELSFTRDYQLSKGGRDGAVMARTEFLPDGNKRVTIETNLPGRILLHWGLQGDEGEGWKLPDKDVWPPGTVEYKRRALQTPFEANGNDNNQHLSITVNKNDKSRYFNFVLKDISSNQWHDLNGGNFHVPLRLDLGRENIPKGEHVSQAVEKPRKKLLDEGDVPSIPQDLSGVWSYMKWESAGCPNRSQEEADREYQNAIRELVMFLRQGVSLDDLRRVAEDGVERYKGFVKDQKNLWEGAPSVPASTAGAKGEKQDNRVMLDQDLVNTMAYLMWERSGKPDGADFGDSAKREIERLLQEGKTIEDIKSEVLKHEDVQKGDTEDTSSQPEVFVNESREAPVVEEVKVGDSIGMKTRNPLDLIHRSSPPRLAEVRNRAPKPLEPLWLAAREDENCVWQRLYTLGSKSELLVTTWKDEEKGPYRVVCTTDNASDIILHWGVKKSGKSWKRPDASFVPEGSELIEDGIAAETPFVGCTDDECHVEIGGSVVPLQRIELVIPDKAGISALTFVLRSGDGSRWWKDGASDFNAPLAGPSTEEAKDMELDDELSQIIVDCEVKSGAWTLMHRFNKAADLLGDIIEGRFEPTEKAMATIFVWLRYSAIRQLTWQRNYNTQPRILGAAQERLTHKIADTFASLKGQGREWARMCLTTVGRGGNAQAVRDEILNIMHRNRVKEVKGTWMEEFHQKLHNNTTPDDIGICEAYIAFLKSGGDLGSYWGVLSDHGINRARLESFDRAIVTEPEFFADKKDALIRDFENYLGILKATHSGADLQASVSAAASFVPSSVKSYLGFVMARANSSEILPLMEAAVEARTEINSYLGDHREVIYLDLALENVVRAAAERGAGAAGAAAAAFVEPLLQNLALSIEENEEICYCLKAWQELPIEVKKGQHPTRDQALRGMAVVERIHRALADISDRSVASLEKLSHDLGTAFGCDEWAVQLFAEEVIRGGPAFALGLVLSSAEPAIRGAADIGAWQVISPVGSIIGVLELVPDLHCVADKVYSKPTVLLAARVTGEEEVPLGAVGIVSRDAPDVLSHLAVRCRNMKALFAACHEAQPLEELESLAGKTIMMKTSAAGSVTWEESEMISSEVSGTDNGRKLKVSKPLWCKKWSIGMTDFKDGIVGAKSKNLANLRGKLPEWIRLPPSVALPFGCFEAVLEHSENKEIAKELKSAINHVEKNGDMSGLAKCREITESIHIPKAAKEEFVKIMDESGVPVPRSEEGWTQAVRALKSVWASKFNERAFTSTKRVGLNFNDVTMAVLVQRVVSARYAFVIHTTNPMSGDENEIYCELVKGMGESIVSGTVPGSALAFKARKDDLDNPTIVLYPSKSQGMFAKEDSLIFRSDSNGEDLEGYAGAGLYDSITTAVMSQEVVDYSSDPIVADVAFAKDVMSRVCKVGAAIEKYLKSPQDIEGVVDPDLNITVVQTRPQM